MRIAITVWNGRIAPVFDVAGQIILQDVEKGKVISKERLLLPLNTAALSRIDSLIAQRVEVLICGAISRPAYLSATARGLTVRGFLSGEVGEVLEAFLNDRLDEISFAMPGCGCGMGRGRRRKQGCRGFQRFSRDPNERRY